LTFVDKAVGLQVDAPPDSEGSLGRAAVLFWRGLSDVVQKEEERFWVCGFTTGQVVLPGRV